ncbi:peptide/nickel transport system permease protein [Pacificibacter maritimus]|uniref:Peptide/nickel transport system permease protein n=1 Tax=Pacificibacter maritimus TaxID=762213 RepID=A0A3N4UH94_9RHOB|nr:ABC transporter permease [Pacificibacter maritimus]RPE66549.1 peptide/nickel transport system permease protein [Pacificibacter maritimus]
MTDLSVKRASALRLWLRLRSLPLIPIVILLTVFIIPAFFAEYIAPHDPYVPNLRARLQPPVGFGGTWEYMLGTDRLGRDILSRILHGSWYVLSVSLIGITVGVVVGTTLGLIAGYARGWFDGLVMRLVDISLALPAMLLALALAAAIGASFLSVVIVVGFALWAYFARQVRAEVLLLRKSDFVARSQVAGSSHIRILFRHILPNVLNTIVVLATLQVGIAIMLDASLSFLGIGIPRPTPTWGLLVSDGRDFIATDWWISFFPGLAILLTVMSANMLGDWLREQLDPRQRQV